MPVVLWNDSGSKGYYPYFVLIDLGDTYNSISQAMGHRLSLEAIGIGRTSKRKKLPLPITTVNREPLCVTVVVQQIVQMHDSPINKHNNAMNFVIADIAHYDLILGMAGLQKQNLDIQWGTRTWHCHTCTEIEDRLICLVSTGAFITTMCAEHTHSYELNLYK